METLLEPLYRHELKRELLRRRHCNPSYSLRAFARDLDVHPSDLSRILSGKKSLSPKTALLVLRKLDWPNELKRSALSSIFEEQKELAMLELERVSSLPSEAPSETARH